MKKEHSRKSIIGNASRVKALDYHLFYAVILKERGHTWQEVLERINGLLEKEGKEPYTTFTNLKDRVNDFYRQHGSTFVTELQPFLLSTDKLDIMRFLISDLLIQYFDAKLDNNHKLATTLGTRIQEAIWKKHQLEQKEEVEEDDAFTALIKKSLEAAGKPEAN